MKSISIGQLRQNPTPIFDEVERGEAYVITRYRKQIARIVPVANSTGVSGAEVMDILRRTPMTDGDRWGDELASDRVEDLGTDPWEQA